MFILFFFCIFFFYCLFFFFFQAEDGIRDLVRSRGLGDVYKRQPLMSSGKGGMSGADVRMGTIYAKPETSFNNFWHNSCLLYTSDAADERSSVDLGGRRIIKKKKNIKQRDASVT